MIRRTRFCWSMTARATTALSGVQRSHPGVRVVQMERHTGRPDMVRNRALREAGHRYVLLSDNDVTFAPDADGAAQGRHARSARRRGLHAPGRLRRRSRYRLRSSPPLHFLCWGTSLKARTVAAARAVGPHRAVGCGIQLIDKGRAESAGSFDENLVFGWGDDGALPPPPPPRRMGMLHGPGRAGLSPTATHDATRLRSDPQSMARPSDGYPAANARVATPALLLFELMLVASALSLRAGASTCARFATLRASSGLFAPRRRRIQASRRVADRDALCADDLDLPRRFAGRTGHRREADEHRLSRLLAACRSLL